VSDRSLVGAATLFRGSRVISLGPVETLREMNRVRRLHGEEPSDSSVPTEDETSSERGAFVGDADVELLDRARAGDQSAIARLWTLHHPAALTAARRFARQPRDAEEMASDAFSGMLSALAAGGGPTGSVRAYLVTSVRNGAATRSRRSSATDVLTDDEEVLDRPGEGPRDPVAHAAELGLVREAFATLPLRWRQVLWRTAVDHDSNIAIAEDMGISPNAVAALSRRARRGMREAYLRIHVTDWGVDDECRPFVDQMTQYAILDTAVSREVRDHVDGCPKCSARVAELRQIDGRLSVVFLAALQALPTPVGDVSAVAGGPRVMDASVFGRLAVGLSVAGLLATSWLMWPASQTNSRADLRVPTAFDSLPRSAVAHVSTAGTATTHPPAMPADGPSSTALSSTSSASAASPSRGDQGRSLTPVATVREPSVHSPSASTTGVPAPKTPPPNPPMVLSVRGKPGDRALTITLAAHGTTGRITLTVILPRGSLLDHADGDWSGCEQVSLTVTCTTHPDVSGVWTGRIHTRHRMGPSGQVLVHAMATAAADSTPRSTTQRFVWRASSDSIDKAAR
jgi:RNA polymerase sigma factor (sigma-70 family)